MKQITLQWRLTQWYSALLIVGSLFFLVTTGADAQKRPLDGPHLKSCTALPNAFKSSQRSTVILVTNDSTSSLVTYLDGFVDLNASGTSLSGDLEELVSNRLESVPDGGLGRSQRFSIKHVETARIEILKPQTLKITWPGGGVTESLLTCTPGGVYLWSFGSYSGLLSLQPLKF